MAKNPDQRVTMEGHDPELILRALLAVNPDDVKPPKADDEGEDVDPSTTQG